MISFLPVTPDVKKPWLFAKGFRTCAHTNLEQIASFIRTFVWSPIVWLDGTRKEAEFVSAEWCVLDFDDPEMSLAQALNVFCDRIHIIGTTKNHQKDKHGVVCDRFRVCLKFEAPITELKHYRYTMQNYMDQYPVDSQCKDGARFFYPCQEIISMADSGYTETIETEVPEWFDKPRDIAKVVAKAKAGVLPRKSQKNLSQVMPLHKRNNLCYGLGKDLTFAGLARDEIISLIINSPTYQGSTDKIDEISQAVDNGSRRAHQEMEAIGVEKR